MKEAKNDRVKRLQIVYIVVFLMFVGIILRLAQIQIQQGSIYANELADRSYKKITFRLCEETFMTVTDMSLPKVGLLISPSFVNKRSWRRKRTLSWWKSWGKY